MAQSARSATLVGNPPPPTPGSASADASGTRAILSPTAARHPAELDLLEHTAATLAQLVPVQIAALISASSTQWSWCSWRILTELNGEQRSAVPVAFYHMMTEQIIARGSAEEFAEVPRWLLSAAGTMTEPRAGTIAQITSVSRRRGRSYKALVVGVSLAFLVGVLIILKMIRWF